MTQETAATSVVAGATTGVPLAAKIALGVLGATIAVTGGELPPRLKPAALE